MRTRRHSPLTTGSRRRTNLIPRLDKLEDRRLMAVAFVETPLAAPAGAYINPYLVTHASDGSVWTIASVGDLNNASLPSAHAIRTDSQGVMTDVPGLPVGESPIALFAGDTGSVWVVTESTNGTGHVVKLTTTFSITGSLPDAPLSATLGGDGDIWFTAHPTKLGDTFVVEKFDPRTGAVTSLGLPGGSFRLGPIVAATDGNIWSVEPDAHKAIKVSLGGRFTEYPLAISPSTIAAGTGGDVWIAGADSIGTPTIVKVTSGGTVTPETTLAQPLPYYGPSTAASSLAAAPDGSLWFINEYQESIGHLKLDGSLDYFPLPQAGRTIHLSLTTDGGTGFYFTQIIGSDLVHLLTDAPDPSVLLTAQSIEHVEGPLSSGLTIATFQTTDATAFPFDFIARYQIGNQLPQLGTVLSDGRGGFVVQTSGSDTIQQPGSELLSVTVIDAKHNNSIGAKSSGIGLVKIDYSPVTVGGQLVSASAGVPYKGTVATFIDPDGNVAGDAQTQSTINWGDGSSSVVLSSGSASGSGLTVPGGHVYTNYGTYTITITANHGGTISTGTSTATVTIPAIASFATVTAGYSQGHASEARVATFETASESVAANYWGVAYPPNDYSRYARIAQVGPTSFEVWVSAAFSSWGEQNLPVYIHSNDGSGDYVPVVDAIVTPAPITASVLPVAINSDLGVYGYSYGNVASFLSSNPQAPASNYRVTITSGDGGPWYASIYRDWNGQFVVQGEHKFPTSATAGTFAVTIKIDNVRSDGQVANAATLTENVSVLATPPLFGQTQGDAVQTNEDAGWVGTIGTFTRTNEAAAQGAITATIHWGDGSPDSAGQIGGISLYSGNEYAAFSVSGGHIFSRSGTFSPTVDLVAEDGEHATISSTVQVLPPPFVATGADLTGTKGTAISGVVATFRDATPSMPSAYAATIDWGDGSTSPGTVSTYQDGYVVFGSHVYTTAGPHAYGVIMQENGGPTVTTSGTVMVAESKPIGVPAGGGTVGGSPMTIISARSIRKKSGSIRVVVTLSGTVDMATVSNRSQYVLTEPGKPGKHPTKGKIDTIASATYDPSTETLTLVPRGTFHRPVAFRVAMQGGTGVTALAS